MPIVRNTSFLVNYPFRVIPDKVLDLMERSAATSTSSPAVTLKLFECFCDITESRITYPGLSGTAFQRTARSFLDSLRSDGLVGTGTEARRAYSKQFLSIISSIQKEIPALTTFEWDWNEDNYQTLDTHNLNSDAVRYWNGWEILSSKGKPHFLALADLWNSHGPEFTEQFYESWRLYSEKQARPAYSETNKMVKFLAINRNVWPPATFYHPQGIKDFFLDFLKNFFMETVTNKRSLNSQIKAWGRFVSNCEEAFIQGGVWAVPFGGKLPKPTPKTIPTVQTRVTTTKNGTQVHNKLITTVPLQITDTEAIEILFDKIESDVQIVKSWALSESHKLVERMQRRKLLAKTGTPISGGSGTNDIHTLGVENICATFERDGFINDKSYLNRYFGSGTPVTDTANYLGLPTWDSLFPFQCLLVMEHPEITTSFLEKFELYDKWGNLSGYCGNQLKGYKDRRGKTHSEQKIELNSRSAELVDKIIEITTPLRDALKRMGDDRWRELFITCGQGFSNPKSASIPSWNPSKFESSNSFFRKLENQFSEHTNLKGKELASFLSKVSLSSIRASCGVLIYLRTKSVEEMANALGHLKYDPGLLRHYLPDSILAFFQTRWIRIFQRGLICEAMKESPYLLEAANFQSMDELHTFLSHHALRDIPSHLKDPEGLLTTPFIQGEYSHIYISIDPGILTALMSLERAVAFAKPGKTVCGRAHYWAELSKSVVMEIERGNDQLLKSHLIEASRHCNASRMENLIYESST